MYDVTKRPTPASSVAAYRFASLLVDRHDGEAAAVLASADLAEVALVLARALAAACWSQDPHGYRDKLRRMADAELTARAAEMV